MAKFYKMEIYPKPNTINNANIYYCLDNLRYVYSRHNDLIEEEGSYITDGYGDNPDEIDLLGVIGKYSQIYEENESFFIDVEILEHFRLEDDIDYVIGTSKRGDVVDGQARVYCVYKLVLLNKEEILNENEYKTYIRQRKIAKVLS